MWPPVSQYTKYVMCMSLLLLVDYYNHSCFTIIQCIYTSGIMSLEFYFCLLTSSLFPLFFPASSLFVFKYYPVSALQAHEFVDEQIYEQNCLETALQSYPSRSPSISSHDSSMSTCCGHRVKRNSPLPNSSLPPTHQGPLQELSAIHIQCGDAPSHTAR